MALKFGIVSQKGGVGKSTLARTIGIEYARAEWEVLIADMDIQQSTSFEWNSRRLQNDIEPGISIQQFHSLDKVAKLESVYNLIIFDGAPHATIQTGQIAAISDLVILPTGSSLDDMTPQVKLAHELLKRGIPREKMVFVLSRMGNSDAEVTSAKEYIGIAGYKIIDGFIREKDAYKQSLDQGRTLSETKFKTLNTSVDEVTQNIVNYVSKSA